MPRAGWGGTSSNRPTFVFAAMTRLPNPAGPRPSGSTFNPTDDLPDFPRWYVTATCPSGPTATSPNAPPPDPGTSWMSPKSPTWPRPDTGAPTATTPSPSSNVSHRLCGLPADPGPVVQVGWSTSPRKLVSRSNVLPPSVLDRTSTCRLSELM